MRTNLIIGVTLALIISISWFSTHKADSIYHSAFEDIDRIEQALEIEGWTEAVLISQDLKDYWSEARHWVTLFLNHRMLNDVEILIYRLDSALQLEDMISAMAELVSLRNYIQELHNDGFLSLENIL